MNLREMVYDLPRADSISLKHKYKDRFDTTISITIYNNKPDEQTSEFRLTYMIESDKINDIIKHQFNTIIAKYNKKVGPGIFQWYMPIKIFGRHPDKNEIRFYTNEGYVCMTEEMLDYIDEIEKILNEL
jgi:hypothetical protein